MKILIVGTGYVGLVTGAVLSELGHHVTCLDIDRKKIDMLTSGHIPFYEPGLKEIVLLSISSGHLKFTMDYATGCSGAEAIFLAVPTPSKEDGSCDLSYFYSAASSLAQHLTNYTVIINKSTVPCGTYAKIESLLSELSKENTAFDVVSNPEFLKEGSAIVDCLRPDRIIIGTSSKRAEMVMREIYAPLTDQGFSLIVMDRASAELTKYAANAMLATRISFMNELSHLCEKVGANIHEIKKGIGSDKRIGSHFLNAGIGYGGSCFPKDIKALIATAKENELSLPILEATERVNESQKTCLIKKLKHHFESQGGLQDKIIALWGLAFKPETDDMREAPSLKIIQELQDAGCKINAFDPVALDSAEKVISNKKNLCFSSCPRDACSGADAIILVTEWALFRSIDMRQVKALMNGDAFFDGRNLFCPFEMEEMGFTYYGIGTQTSCILSSKNMVEEIQA